MSEQIIDGSGTGNRAKVDGKNRLHTFAVTEAKIAVTSDESGNAFMIASDFISLTTTASFNGLMYIKNNSDENLHILQLRTCSSEAGFVQVELDANPTGGTLISDANEAKTSSLNLGSSKEFSGLSYAASGDGKTLTGGSPFTQFINKSPGHSIEDFKGAIVLPKGSSLSIKAKPSVATIICMELQCWFEDKK